MYITLKCYLYVMVQYNYVTFMWSWYEPQTAVLQGSVFQGDPEPNQLHGIRVQECGVLVRNHCNNGTR